MRHNQHTRKMLTAEQKAAIADLRQTHTVAELAARFNRSTRHIERTLRQLGVKREVYLLTPEETALVLEHYPATGTAVLARLLPHLSGKQLNHYAHRHGLKFDPWTPEQTEILKALCAEGKPYRVICAAVGKSRGSVTKRLALLGLQKVAAPRWGDRPLKEKAVKEKVARAPKPKAEKAPKPPVMRVVREKPVVRLKPDFRSKARSPQGKKRVTVAFEGKQKLSDYLRPLSVLHPHRRLYDRLTRPGQPRRVLRTLSDLLAAGAEAGFDSLPTAA